MGSNNSSSLNPTDENLHKAEQDVIELSGLSIDQYQRLYVPVTDFNGNTVHIRTLINSTNTLQQNTKPVLVVIHGFGSSSAQYYLAFKHFREHFYMILIDNIGTGASSRPSDYVEKFSDSAEKSTSYFVDYIEKWRVAMDNLTDFYLLGHSYGGYMAGSYASIHHQHIKRLMLMSPIGLRQPDDSTDYLRPWMENENVPWILRGSRQVIEWVWHKKITPLSVYRFFGSKNTKRIIENFKRLAFEDDETKEESKLTAIYLSMIFNRTATTESGLMIDFKPGLQAYYPLTNDEKLCQQEFPIPVSVMYGDIDWTDKLDGDAYKKIFDCNSQPDKCKLYWVPNCEHNPQFENPIAFANIMRMAFLDEEDLPLLKATEYQQQATRNAAETHGNNERSVAFEDADIDAPPSVNINESVLNVKNEDLEGGEDEWVVVDRKDSIESELELA